MTGPLPDGAYDVSIDRKAFTGPDGRPVEVLDGLSFRLPYRSFTCLIGPSGCGKTTTLRILTRLDTDYDGHVDDAFSAVRLAVAFQEPRLLPWRTVAQNIALALPEGFCAETTVAGALEAVELTHHADRFPAQLSLGQARRAALARAFAVEPDVLILDEPFVSLDEATAQRLRALLLRLVARSNATTVMVTHNVREAVQLADRIIVLTEAPARVAGEVTVDLPRDARTPPDVERFAATLTERFPGLVTL